jgi:malonyl-CoA/methylmalonyl-CoA synthetase
MSTESEIIGNLQIFNGPTVFKEYFNNPEATKKEFTDDGWFVTGDSVSYDPSLNSFKILGRISCDIIKSKGYKISALEMETKLLELPVIADCAVVGLPDEAHGQKIVALIQLKDGNVIETPEQEAQAAKELEKWCQQKFASYSLPNIKIVNKILRNQMGKVNKADLVKDLVAKADAEQVK